MSSKTFTCVAPAELHPYISYAALLLQHVPWEYLKRVDGHQIQNKVCSVGLLGKSEWLCPRHLFSPLSHQAFY